MILFFLKHFSCLSSCSKFPFSFLFSFWNFVSLGAYIYFFPFSIVLLYSRDRFINLVDFTPMESIIYREAQLLDNEISQRNICNSYLCCPKTTKRFGTKLTLNEIQVLLLKKLLVSFFLPI